MPFDNGEETDGMQVDGYGRRKEEKKRTSWITPF
jgi:hypothetical protein